MHKNKTTFFVAIFVAMMIFGSFGFSMMRHTSDGMCPFAATMGMNCHQAEREDIMVLYSLESFRQITGGFLVDNILSIIFVAFVISLFVLVLRKPNERQGVRLSKFIDRRRAEYKKSSIFRSTLFWSAIHNKCDAIALKRVQEFSTVC